MFSMNVILRLVVLVGLLDYASMAPKPEPYKCPRSKGQYADPLSCRRFYICNENHPYSQACPPGLYFDDVKKHCMHKTKDLICGPVPLPPIVTTTVDPLRADKCDEAQCSLPKCHCSRDGTKIPGRVPPNEVPMMVTISFDGALNYQNVEYYQNVLNITKKNPNSCPATFTFFVSHSYSSYYNIQQMAAAGHEIALNGIYSREPETWWETATKDELKEQFEGLRSMLVKYANLTKESIVGMRSPFLRNGGNDMAIMMREMGLKYDSSLPAARNVPLWPYTFDYRMPHRCIGGSKCPTRSFEGVWEYPMNMLFTEDGMGGSCALADQCVFQQDEDLIYDFLLENFNRHYKSNRAPLGLYFHSNWFQNEEKVAALKRFIQKVQDTHKDVWFVSVKRALEWTQTPSASAASHPAFSCVEKPPTSCYNPRTCILTFTQDDVEETRYMQTCSACPLRYPWVGNVEGLPLPGDVIGEDSGPRELGQNQRNVLDGEGDEYEDEISDEDY